MNPQNIIKYAKQEISKRPIGITTSAVIFGLMGIFCFLLSVIAPLGMLNILPVKFGPDTPETRIFLGILSVIFFTPLWLIFFNIAYEIWHEDEKGRQRGVAFGVIATVISIPVAAGVMQIFFLSNQISAIIIVLMMIIILYFLLFDKRTRLAFQSKILDKKKFWKYTKIIASFILVVTVIAVGILSMPLLH
ncbi:MAG: hypothetical protein CVT88_08965 [Candidatus Altiarchaeales archaeon HGW-Altiarchaeales-1]|nr:MAG: hypothetical protein CVT88_08965 [Candidatus Altiarchaeales archaeon HGW-Altiarchaeales-1]PKP57756.1 MAG: hypothetical protein CVT89_03945 [Candidatus Altiarchaeales archaeon HGW-Altiarchaeales-2]